MGKLNVEILPREKAIKYGFQSLSDEELLAIILRTGYKGENVLELSKRILDNFNGLSYLKTVTITDLRKIKGLKDAKALNLLAVFEIAKRMNGKKQDLIFNNEDAFNLIYPIFESLEQECFYALILNSRNTVLAIRLITKGCINGMYVDAVDIIRECLKVNGRKLYLFHNHPSGCVIPSESDIITTEEIYKSCLKFHIILLDHLVIGKNEFLSIKTFVKNKRETEKKNAAHNEITS